MGNSINAASPSESETPAPGTEETQPLQDVNTASNVSLSHINLEHFMTILLFKVAPFATTPDQAERGVTNQDTSDGPSCLPRVRAFARSVSGPIQWMVRVFVGEILRDAATDAWALLQPCCTELFCPAPEVGDNEDVGDQEDGQQQEDEVQEED